ncbi:MAG: anaerobic ribonucleoside-triphosphate reductase activating protein [Staphylothermus sp.]|nr:anaerobic ribonucleoside-triphosphate reductase activating protein [Staphylothermus sp.]
MRNKPLSIKLVGSGWKPISMVDVYNAVTFTIWLCGCNLKCPFCHNWRLAEIKRDTCRLLDIDLLFEELDSAKSLIDYIHVTGGEPLVQWRDLIPLFKYLKQHNYKISINTNMTLYKPLEKIIEEEIVDHIATDLKYPPQLLYGLPENAVSTLWKQFLKSLRLVAEHTVPLELRVPVPKNIDYNSLVSTIDNVIKIIEKTSFYIVLNPLLGSPITTPRNIEWCRVYCDPGKELLFTLREKIKELGIERVYVKENVYFG